MWFFHLLSLLVHSFVGMPERIGTNWFGLLYESVGLVVIGQAVTCCVYRAMKMTWAEARRKVVSEWKTSATISILTLLSFAVILMSVSLVATTYDDHQNLVGVAARFKRSIQTEKARHFSEVGTVKQQLGSSIESLKTTCAVKEGVNQTLQKQNRDEQVLIAGCQSEAIKRLTPEPFKMDIVPFDQDTTNIEDKSSRWILLTNKSITPVDIVVACTSLSSDGTAPFSLPSLAVINLHLSVLGAANIGAGMPQRVARDAWRARILSPAWTRVTPLLVDVHYRGPNEIQCRFEPKF